MMLLSSHDDVNIITVTFKIHCLSGLSRKKIAKVKMEKTLEQRTAKWLKENPEVGELCRNGETIFYVMRNHKKIEIERFDCLLFAELEEEKFYS